MEEFKQIPGRSQYAISRQGIVKRIEGTRYGTERILKQTNNNGYKYVTLITKDDTNDLGEPIQTYHYRHIAVHRLVAITFIDNPQSLPEVNHLDNNKANNNISNLQWVTHAQNIQHSFKTGRKTKKGAESPLYGTKASPATKAKMSQAKQGKNHPKFKGYYIVHHRKYTSAIQAAKDTKENARTILRKCKKGQQHSEYYFVTV